MSKLLDYTGLGRFLDKLKTLFIIKLPTAILGNISVFNNEGDITDGGKSIAQTQAVLFGMIDSTSTATELTATVNGLTEIVPGTTVYIYNGVISGSSSCTLNINNLGAFPIYRGGNEYSRVGFSKNHTWQLIYNPIRVEGGCWDIQYGWYSYVNLGYYDRETDFHLIAKEGYDRATIGLSYSDTEIVPLTNNWVFTTFDFNPFGLILHLGYRNNAGERIDTSWYLRNTVDLRSIIDLPANYIEFHKIVYLKCEPLIDSNNNRTGRVKLATDSNCPLVLDLPTTEDGYVYIYLGVMGGQYYLFRLHAFHPIYEFKDGAIRLWTNQEEHLALTSEEIDRDIIEIVEWEDPVFKLWILGNSSFGVNNNIIIPGEVLQSQLDAVTSYAGGSNNYSVSKGDDLAKFTNMTNMGSNMFTSLSLMTSVLLPSKLLTIGMASFSGCSSLLEIILPNTLSYIDYGAFRYCTSLQTITVPDNVYYLGSEAFNGCTNLKTAIIGNGVTSLSGYTFYMCTSLESIVIGNSVTSIGQNDLARCSSLTSVTFGNSLTSIGSDAFWECTALKTLEFPDSLTNITPGAFSGCNLEVVDFGNTRSSIVPYVYFGLNTIIIVPDSLVEDWKATSGWSSIASLIVSYSEYHNSN